MPVRFSEASRAAQGLRGGKEGVPPPPPSQKPHRASPWALDLGLAGRLFAQDQKANGSGRQREIYPISQGWPCCGLGCTGSHNRISQMGHDSEVGREGASWCGDPSMCTGALAWPQFPMTTFYKAQSLGRRGRMVLCSAGTCPPSPIPVFCFRTKLCFFTEKKVLLSSELVLPVWSPAGPAHPPPAS